MSVWWIGVKSNGKMRAFEATKAEAFSEEFEETYGIAFGSFRSKIQAEADIKRHSKHLSEQANIERLKRLEIDKKEDIPLNTKEKANKLANNLRKTLEKPLKTSKPAELSNIPQRLQIVSLVFEEFEGLKLQIIRALEALKLLKQELEEENDKNNNRDLETGKSSG
jgi:hypothetical protein